MREESNPKSQPELVFGIVAAVGANLEHFQNILTTHLAAFGYRSKIQKVSEYFKNIEIIRDQLIESPEDVRLESYINAGNAIRRWSRRPDFLALYSASEISRLRPERNDRSIPNTAHIINSLKRPEEVTQLRSIYGPGFFLVGVYSPQHSRVDYLVNVKSIPRERAMFHVRRDQKEDDPFGQRTRDTFKLADVFIRLDLGDPDQTGVELCRFLDLVFSDPYHTPKEDEQAMFLAYAASLRSGSLARQVGAVITSARGDVIATGANDVPKAGGGLYWPGAADRRDHVKGFDSNDERRDRMILEIMERLNPDEERSPQEKEELLAKGKAALKESMVFDITEFGRAVHAEMEALLCAARAGVSPVGGTLYCTTFPCHNCAKHIVAAGIKRVVYVEPYPKSQAKELHSDSIVVEGEEDACHDSKVHFEPFVGIGPRRYFDLFSLGLSTGYPIERKKDGRMVDWNSSIARPRVPMHPTTYIDREIAAAGFELKNAMEEARKNVLVEKVKG